MCFEPPETLPRHRVSQVCYAGRWGGLFGCNLCDRYLQQLAAHLVLVTVAFWGLSMSVVAVIVLSFPKSWDVLGQHNMLGQPPCVTQLESNGCLPMLQGGVLQPLHWQWGRLLHPAAVPLISSFSARVWDGGKGVGVYCVFTFACQLTWCSFLLDHSMGMPGTCVVWVRVGRKPQTPYPPTEAAVVGVGFRAYFVTWPSLTPGAPIENGPPSPLRLHHTCSSVAGAHPTMALLVGTAFVALSGHLPSHVELLLI